MNCQMPAFCIMCIICYSKGIGTVTALKGPAFLLQEKFSGGFNFLNGG